MSKHAPAGRPRLLLSHLGATSFVRDDVALLGEDYDVRAFAFEAHRAEGGRGRALLRGFAAQRAWLRREAPGAAAILSWFADYHAVQPVRAGRRLGVPTAIALGGYDAVRLPELGYGVFDSAWRAPLARYALCHTDLLLPVAEALIASENTFAAWPTPTRQGVRVHAPRCTTPYVVAPTGYEPEEWPIGMSERGATACTVAHVTSERVIQIKGIDLLIEVARHLPDVLFRVVGVPEAMQERIRQRHDPPTNVVQVAPCPRESLPAEYGRASVYLQLSRTEGLPNALCEAMLCGCIPVGSRVGGIPDVIGATGVIVDAPSPKGIAAAVHEALARATAGRTSARERIVQRFTRDHRRRVLFEALGNMTRTT